MERGTNRTPFVIIPFAKSLFDKKNTNLIHFNPLTPNFLF